jgi:hypothetical protein
VRFPIGRLPAGAVVKGAAAQLTDAEGKEVAAWLSSPEKTGDEGLQRNTVCLIAREPLRPKTKYTVTVSARVDGEEWKQTWSFTTGGGP